MKFAFSVVLVTTALFATDVKVTVRIRETNSALPNIFGPEHTMYVHGTIERIEFLGYAEYFETRAGQRAPHMAVISHCDTGVSYQIDLDNHEYREVKLPKYLSEKEFGEQVKVAKKQAERHIKSNTVDTGETQDFHGHSARHQITTISEKSDYTHAEETVDGWYLDLPQPGCAPEYTRWGKVRQNQIGYVPGSGLGIAGSFVSVGQDMIGVTMIPNTMSEVPARFAYTGYVPGGFTIRSKSVIHQTLIIQGQARQSDLSIEREVLDFSEGPLDPSLFEVPAGFTKVNHLYKHIPN